MSRRIERINELLQQELSKIIQGPEYTKLGIFLSVQEVVAAEDLKSAKVWVSVFGQKLNEKDEKDIIDKLQKKAGEFQSIIASKLELKYTPRLTFKLDVSGEAMQKIDDLVEKSKKMR